MAERWSKRGGPGLPLPFMDTDASGSVWSDLANSPEGREACGWALAEVPEEVTMAQARLALVAFGRLAEADAWVAAQDEETRSDWRSAERVRRTAPRILAAADALGWTEDFLDDLFFAAAAVPIRQGRS